MESIQGQSGNPVKTFPAGKSLKKTVARLKNGVRPVLTPLIVVVHGSQYKKRPKATPWEKFGHRAMLDEGPRARKEVNDSKTAIN